MKNLLVLILGLFALTTFAKQGVPSDFRVGRNLTVNGFIFTPFHEAGWQSVTDGQYTSGSPLAIEQGDTTALTNNAATSVTLQKPSFNPTLFATNKVYGLTGDVLQVQVNFNAVSDSAVGANAYLYVTSGSSYLQRVKLEDLNTTRKLYSYTFTIIYTSAMATAGVDFKLWSILGDTDVDGVSYNIVRTYQGR